MSLFQLDSSSDEEGKLFSPTPGLGKDKHCRVSRILVALRAVYFPSQAMFSLRQLSGRRF